MPAVLFTTRPLPTFSPFFDADSGFFVLTPSWSTHNHPLQPSDVSLFNVIPPLSRYGRAPPLSASFGATNDSVGNTLDLWVVRRGATDRTELAAAKRSRRHAPPSANSQPSDEELMGPTPPSLVCSVQFLSHRLCHKGHVV